MLPRRYLSSYPFRVFISYSHDDAEPVRRVAAILERIGLVPIWDEQLLPGFPFDQQIMNFIRSAHLFMPLITAGAYNRPWVHQEIGFAMGVQIPVLPLALGQLPGELIQKLQVVAIPNDLTGLEDKLMAINFERLVNSYYPLPLGVTVVRETPTERTQSIVENTERLLRDEQLGYVRQRGGLGTFSIPDKPVTDPIWRLRAGGEGVPDRNDYEKSLLRRERQALEKHARAQGCTLMLRINDQANDKGAIARITRLTLVRDFLNKIPAEKVKIVFLENDLLEEVLLVGDYFFAGATTLSRYGVNRTEFCFHPVEVYHQVTAFDREIADEEKNGPTAKKSAMEQITAKINDLKKTLSPEKVTEIDATL